MDAQIEKLERLKAKGERLAATLDARNADREALVAALRAAMRALASTGAGWQTDHPLREDFERASSALLRAEGSS